MRHIAGFASSGDRNFNHSSGESNLDNPHTNHCLKTKLKQNALHCFATYKPWKVQTQAIPFYFLKNLANYQIAVVKGILTAVEKSAWLTIRTLACFSASTTGYFWKRWLYKFVTVLLFSNLHLYALVCLKFRFPVDAEQQLF